MRWKGEKSYSRAVHQPGFSVAILRKTRQAGRVEGDFLSPFGTALSGQATDLLSEFPSGTIAALPS